MTTKSTPIRHDWLSKVLAGTLLGFMIALGCSGIFAELASSLPRAAMAQLAMWLVMPIWLSVLCGCFFFRSGWRAWLWLGAASLLVFAALAAVRLT